MTTYGELKKIWPALNRLVDEREAISGAKRLKLGRFMDVALPALTRYEKLEQQVWADNGGKVKEAPVGNIIEFPTPDARSTCQAQIAALALEVVDGLTVEPPTFTEEEIANTSLSAAEMMTVLGLIEVAAA